MVPFDRYPETPLRHVFSRGEIKLVMNSLLNNNGSPLDYLLEGFQLIGYDWKYLYVNDAVAKQGKYDKEDLLGCTMMEKYPGIDQTEMFKRLHWCMKKRTSDHFENQFVFPDKTVGWFELRIHPVPEGIFILSIDITDRKQAEQAKSEYIVSLEEMIFITSHRVRQPVTNILGVLNLMEKSKLSIKELEIVTGSLKESIRTLDRFTRDLTDYIHELSEKYKVNK